MPIFGGLKFKEVQPYMRIGGSYVLIVQDVSSSLMFVRIIRNLEDATTAVRNYRVGVFRQMGTKQEVELRYYVHKQISDMHIPLGALKENVRMDLSKQSKLWTNQRIVRKTGEVVDLNQTGYYVYCMVNKTTGAVYIDYDFSNKALVNPMSPKAVTFNGFVMRKCVHTNRTMYNYTKEHFPIKPDDWIWHIWKEGVIGERQAGIEVSKLSVSLLNGDFTVLNTVYGVDAHYYRTNHTKLLRKTMESYVKAVHLAATLCNYTQPEQVSVPQ